MDTFRIVTSVTSFVVNSILVILILRVRVNYFSAFKWYILALPLNNLLYTFILLAMDIHHGTYGDAVFTASFGIISGPSGVGIYQGCISHYYSIIFLLFLYRFSLVYKGVYVSCSLHVLLSSFSTIIYISTLVFLLDAFYFCLPAFFYHPDSSAVDYVAPAMKSFFDKGREYGYAMQIIWIRGHNEFGFRNFVGAAGTLLINISYLLSIAIMSHFILKNGSVSHSNTLRIRERDSSTVAVIYLGIGSAQVVLTLFPFVPLILPIMSYVSFFFRISVVLVPSLSPILLFLQLRDFRVLVYNRVMKTLGMEKKTVKTDKSTTK